MVMAKNIFVWGIVFLLAAVQPLSAQVSGLTCSYRVELYDDFGDGWIGSELELETGDTIYRFFLDNITDDGSRKVFFLDLADGDSLTVTYVPGIFEEDVRFAVFNAEGEQIVAGGPEPAGGVLLETLVTCAACAIVLPDEVSVSRIRSSTADIFWGPGKDPLADYLLEYGEHGFEPGSGRTRLVSTPAVRLNNLVPDTGYDIYFTVLCASGDTSRTSGPVFFETRPVNDVGIVDIVAPVSDCNLSQRDSVKVVMKNFGGVPQSLVPFQYSVNGVDAGVPIPRDGFYTGALGVDSTVVIAFETTYDFSEPGEYVIVAWTALEEDGDMSNDTFAISVVSVPEITSFPYFENFETWGGGWTVDPSSRYSSWAYGDPQGDYIERAFSGSGAWVTNLNGPYNGDEFSYLLSPCFDFSSLSRDPRLSFALIVDTELCETEICDRFWVEWTRDGGVTWEKVQTATSTLNWYNDKGTGNWTGSGSQDGWFVAYTVLPGGAGEANVRIRLAFASDFLFNGEGIGIDDIFISEPLRTDLALHEVRNSALLSCGDGADQVQVTLTNFGEQSLSNINLYYRVNGGVPVRENTGSAVLASGAQQKFAFERVFDSSIPGDYEVAVWSAIPGDQFRANDTTYLRFSTAYPLPYTENFEGGYIPRIWSVEGGGVGADADNTSQVLFENLFEFNTSFEATSPALGSVSPGDVLSFDYRYVAFEGGAYTLEPGDELSVAISTDCGLTFEKIYTVNASNHEPGVGMQKIVLPLDAYVGSYIKFRIQATWGSGDYLVDLDNFFVGSCPPALNLGAQVTDVSASGSSDGAITLFPEGIAEEYVFSWNTGASRNAISQLTEGVYQVTVTDPYGCTDNYEFVVGVGVNTDEQMERTFVRVFPNPSADGQFAWNISSETTIDRLDILLYDTMQRLIKTDVRRSIRDVNGNLDLSAAASGVYFVQVIADGVAQTIKVVKL